MFPHPTDILPIKRLPSGTQKAWKRMKQLIHRTKYQIEGLHRGKNRTTWNLGSKPQSTLKNKGVPSLLNHMFTDLHTRLIIPPAHQKFFDFHLDIQGP